MIFFFFNSVQYPHREVLVFNPAIGTKPPPPPSHGVRCSLHVTCAWHHLRFSGCQRVSPLPAQVVTTSSGPSLTCDAAMPPNRTSRPRSIPENLIVNWRPSDLRDAAKPLLRRPVTACDACRTAKAKCSGRQGCDRCTARGLVCTYTSHADPNRCPPRVDGVQPPSMAAVVPAGSSSAGDSPSSAGLESITPAGWANDLQHQSIITLDVSGLETALFCVSIG